MKRIHARLLALALLVPAALFGLPSTPRAQEATPSPVVIVGNTQATLVFDKVPLAPGEHVEQRLDLSGFARVSFLAAAESGPNTGLVVVQTRFGPPVVPVKNTLTLAFAGGTTARRSDHMPVMGPHLSVELVNRSAQPVEVSLSVYASK